MLKKLCLHFHPKEQYSLSIKLVEHISSKEITKLVINCYSMSFDAIDHIIGHLPTLSFIGLFSDIYNVAQISNPIDTTNTPSSHTHSCLQIIHIITFCYNIEEIITNMIAVTRINWSNIKELTITRPIKCYQQEYPLHTFHPKLISLASNLQTLHLCLTEGWTVEHSKSYGM